MNEIRAWHFLKNDCRLGYNDYRLVVAGETLSVDPPVELCEWGMHASWRVIDALPFATGPLISRVILSGDLQHAFHGRSKSVATSRKTLWILDCTEALRRFSRWAVNIALTEAGVTDRRSWDAINANALWHAGELDYEELTKFRDASLRAVSESAVGTSRAIQQRATQMAARLLSNSDTTRVDSNYTGRLGDTARRYYAIPNTSWRTAQHMRSRLYTLPSHNKKVDGLVRRANIMLTQEIMELYWKEGTRNAIRNAK